MQRSFSRTGHMQHSLGEKEDWKENWPAWITPWSHFCIQDRLHFPVEEGCFTRKGTEHKRKGDLWKKKKDWHLRKKRKGENRGGILSFWRRDPGRETRGFWLVTGDGDLEWDGKKKRKAWRCWGVHENRWRLWSFWTGVAGENFGSWGGDLYFSSDAGLLEWREVTQQLYWLTVRLEEIYSVLRGKNRAADFDGMKGILWARGEEFFSSAFFFS